MKLETEGVLIDLRPLGDRDALARIFTRDYGVMTGMMRGAVIAKKNRPLVGQMGAVAWNARLDSQVGLFHWEAACNLAAPVMMDAVRLGMLNAAFSLIITLLPERESYGALYSETVEFVTDLPVSVSPDVAYLRWEADFLAHIGYALRLDACAGCGGHDNLDYLSPRTFRAVCVKCAAPYIDKLYRLPLSLDTSCMLMERVCTAQGATVPSARRMLRYKKC